MKPRVRAYLVPFGPFVTFVPRTERSAKVMCSVCRGAGGYDGQGKDGLSPWQWTHLRGHKPCDYCSKWLVVLLDGSTRVHGRCPA